MDIKQCQLCSTSFTNLTYLLKHIRQVHSQRPGFRIVCGLSGCQRTFGSFGSYRNHIYGFHHEREPLVINSVPAIEDDMDTSTLTSESDNVDPSMIKDSAAAWILKVQEQHKLPHSTMEDILKDVIYLCQVIL